VAEAKGWPDVLCVGGGGGLGVGEVEMEVEWGEEETHLLDQPN
jgi:hypothetical protein